MKHNPTQDKWRIGIDIGGTKIAFALVDSQGQVMTAYRLATRAEEGLEAVIEQIVTGVNALGADDEIAVGVGCPGYIRDGVVQYATNLNWRDVPLQGILFERLARHISIENDVNAMLFGERMYGAAREHANAVYLSIGTGLGAAAMADGRLLRGASGVAMELGHINRADGSLFEDGASGGGLLKMVAAMRDDYPTALDAAADTQAIISAATNDDELAGAAVCALAHNIAEAAAWVCSTLNPSAVIIGGGMGIALKRWLIPTVETRIKAACPEPVSAAVTVCTAQVKDSAVGAAALAR
ncbi:MAG: ROK family protein [Anaerolineaceae bacterium]|nr:MAG: ROK family protein [Anaerolineaceae bacterium]